MMILPPMSPAEDEEVKSELNETIAEGVNILNPKKNQASNIITTNKSWK